MAVFGSQLIYICFIYVVIQRLRRRVYLYLALEDVKPSEGEAPDGNVSFVLAGTCNGIVTLPIWWQRSSGKRPPSFLP